MSSTVTYDEVLRTIPWVEVRSRARERAKTILNEVQS